MLCNMVNGLNFGCTRTGGNKRDSVKVFTTVIRSRRQFTGSIDTITRHRSQTVHQRRGKQAIFLFVCLHTYTICEQVCLTVCAAMGKSWNEKENGAREINVLLTTLSFYLASAEKKNKIRISDTVLLLHCTLIPIKSETGLPDKVTKSISILCEKHLEKMVYGKCNPLQLIIT